MSQWDESDAETGGACPTVPARKLNPPYRPSGLSDTWPLSWAPPAEHWQKGQAFDESKRLTDRADAPRVVAWRGHQLLREPNIMPWSGGKVFGFENRAEYSGPDPVWHTTISCDGGKALIGLCGEEETFAFAGEGENEQQALDAAAAIMERFISSLRAIVGEMPLVSEGARVRIIGERSEWVKLHNGRCGTVKKLETWPNGEVRVSVQIDGEGVQRGNIRWTASWFRREDLEIVE